MDIQTHRMLPIEIQSQGGDGEMFPSDDAACIWRPAEHLEQVARSGNLLAFTWDEAGRLAETERPFSSVSGEFSYDGRGFLSHGSGDGYDIVDFVDPVYTSEGLLVLRNRTQFEHFQEDYVLYFGQRPVALFQRVLSSLASEAVDSAAPTAASERADQNAECDAGENCPDQEPF